MELKIDCGRHGSVPALLDEPADAEWLLVLGHGAGAGMRHAFTEAVARGLAARGVATLRYEFPYMAAGRRRPDPAPVLQDVVRGVAAWAAACRGTRRLAAGGRSMGGRMTSLAQAAGPLPQVEVLVFLGFPLHPARLPGTTRAAHLQQVALPMLFVQGDRDALAELPLMRGTCASLAGTATLHVVAGADHGFDVLRRSGRTAADVLDEVVGTVAGWLRGRPVAEP
jgi:uncharacterized protein